MTPIESEQSHALVLDRNGTAWQYRGDGWGWYASAPGLAPMPDRATLEQECGPLRPVRTG